MGIPGGIVWKNCTLSKLWSVPETEFKKNQSRSKKAEPKKKIDDNTTGTDGRTGIPHGEKEKRPFERATQKETKRSSVRLIPTYFSLPSTTKGYPAHNSVTP